MSTKNVVDFQWHKKDQRAFEEVKSAVLENACAGGDESKQYHLCTDASKTGTGGILFQLRNATVGTPINKDLWSQIQIIMFLSAQLTSAQSRSLHRKNGRHWLGICVVTDGPRSVIGCLRQRD